jgi:hypothetical protein
MTPGEGVPIKRTAGMGYFFDQPNISMGCYFHQSVIILRAIISMGGRIIPGIYHINYTVMKYMVRIMNGYDSQIQIQIQIILLISPSMLVLGMAIANRLTG